MSNIIPPMVSSSPPPMDDTMEEDEDDEFGDFAAADDIDVSPAPVPPAIRSAFWGEEVKQNNNTLDEDDEGDRKEVERIVGQDNTSQDSVVSGTTDSGLCSASQNSDGASPSPLAGSSPSPVDPDREESSGSDETLVKSIDMDARVVSDAQTDVVTEESFASLSDNFDNFSDFQSVSGEVVRTDNKSEDVRKHLSEEVTDEFGDFESVPANEDGGEFDDFESAEIHCSVPLDQSELVNRLQTIVTSLFPLSTGSLLDVNIPQLDERLAALWAKLKDVESSHALSYQWSGSSANKSLLMALGIDSRNILFGARWNTSVPRFAANLGFSPLEPVRANRSSPAPVAATTTTTTTAPTDQEPTIPAAQFDWNSSGLVNPLDSTAEMPTNNALVQGILEVSTSNELVERILACSQTTPAAQRSRQGLSAEAVRVLDDLPDLSFLQAKLLMFPVRGTSP